MQYIVVIIILFSLLTASVTITIVIREARIRSRWHAQRKAILQSGTPAQALIRSIQQTNVQVGDQPEVLLDLTVTLQDGETMDTVVKTVIPIVRIPEFQAGNHITVKYTTIDNERRFEVVGAYVPGEHR